MNGMNGFAVVSVVMTLAVLLILNWGYFQRLGAPKVLRLLLIWGVILTAGVLILKVMGY